MKKNDFAQAMPTKQFFVSMLTRDINLADAILDLVDNCLDGALRISNGNEVDYSLHSIRIDVNENFFQIEDNCGGIPRDTAKNYAFKMGREQDDDRDMDNETIGMYGVGMKRAIFKMGLNAKVKTRFEDDLFEVPITEDWLKSKDWNPLPIIDEIDATQFQEPGTLIRVESLYPGVAKHFSNDSFKNELRLALSEHFTMFLQHGLTIIVNNDRIEPVRVEVLVSEEVDGPAPYIYQDVIDNVNVSITVGLNTSRGLASDDDDAPEFERDRSAATAGWTVFCNDRAVIVGDKSRLTGWGDGIPLYHYQFSIITGIIEFRSNHADKLPVTTTKRALDTSSDVWLQSIIKMKEGMRIWINYTNAWKNHRRSEQTKFWETAKPLPLRQTIETVSQRENATKRSGAIEYNPQKHKVVPLPPSKMPSSRRIIFSRINEEIREVSKFLFDSFDEKPGLVGEKCFELVLSEAQKKGRQTHA